MKQSTFYKMFLDLLQETYDMENQIVQALPDMIKNASHKELKEGLSIHLNETKDQIKRIDKVFDLIDETPNRKLCKVMQALVQAGHESVERNYGPSVTDATIIICAQQIEHHEIALYGSLCALAEQLNDADFEDKVDFDEIIDLLDENLDEESSADKKLTSIAEGGIFSEGINEEAKREATVRRR